MGWSAIEEEEDQRQGIVALQGSNQETRYLGSGAFRCAWGPIANAPFYIHAAQILV
jgi:hypothetical protein